LIVEYGRSEQMSEYDLLLKKLEELEVWLVEQENLAENEEIKWRERQNNSAKLYYEGNKDAYSKVFFKISKMLNESKEIE